MIGDIDFQFNINHCNNVTAKKNSNKKWLSLKSIGLGESDLDYDGGNCINSKVMGQVHKDLNTKSFLKRGITVK